MTDKELVEYISNRKYKCSLCYDLQQEVIKRGIEALIEYDGMQCSGIEGMLESLSDERKG